MIGGIEDERRWDGQQVLWEWGRHHHEYSNCDEHYFLKDSLMNHVFCHAHFFISFYHSYATDTRHIARAALEGVWFQAIPIYAVSFACLHHFTCPDRSKRFLTQWWRTADPPLLHWWWYQIASILLFLSDSSITGWWRHDVQQPVNAAPGRHSRCGCGYVCLTS